MMRSRKRYFKVISQEEQQFHHCHYMNETEFCDQIERGEGALLYTTYKNLVYYENERDYVTKQRRSKTKALIQSHYIL